MFRTTLGTSIVNTDPYQINLKSFRQKQKKLNRWVESPDIREAKGLKNWRSTKSLHKINRGARTSILDSDQPDVIFNYHSLNPNQIEYNDEGKLISAGVNDEFNKKIVQSMKPKNIAEELNIKSIGVRSKLST